MVNFWVRLAASIHSAYLFGLLRLYFCTMSTEVYGVDPEQCKVFCRLHSTCEGRKVYTNLLRKWVSFFLSFFFFQ